MEVSMFNLYTLDNGLRVVTEYIEHVNSISVGIMVQNGSRNETKDENEDYEKAQNYKFNEVSYTQMDNYNSYQEKEQSDYYSNMGYSDIKTSRNSELDSKLDEISTQGSFLETQDDTLDKIINNSQDSKFRASDFKVIGTILNTYIVLEKGTSMYL